VKMIFYEIDVIIKRINIFNCTKDIRRNQYHVFL